MSGPPRKAAPKPPGQTAPDEPVLCQARVTHAYKADGDKELSLIEGETIDVLQKDTDLIQ